MTDLPPGYLVYCGEYSFELDIPGEHATPCYATLQEAAQAAWEHFRGNPTRSAREPLAVPMTGKAWHVGFDGLWVEVAP